MSSEQHNASLLDLEPDTIIELYELDLGEEQGIYRFHPGKNNLKDILLRDDFGVLHTYYSLPIEATDFDIKGDGTLPRPKLIIANPQGLLSDAIKRRGDLIGNTIVRKRIFLKFLDHENFPNNLNPFAIPDPEARFDDDIFKVNRKTQENKFYIEFELASPLELEDINVPARVMLADYCPWQYRGQGCLYGKRTDFNNQFLNFPNGTFKNPQSFFANENESKPSNGPNLGMPIADENNKLFVDPKGYNLNLTWQSDYVSSAVSVTVNGSVNQVDVVTNTENKKSIVQVTDDYPSGATTINVIANVNIVDEKVITFNNGATFTLNNSGDVTGSDSAQNIVGVLNGDISENTQGTVAQTISLSSGVGVALSSGDTITFLNNVYFTLDEDALSGATSLSGILTEGIPSGSNGQGIIQSVAIDALTDDIKKSRYIVFSSGATLQLTTSASTGDTTLYGILSGDLADDEVGATKYLPGDTIRIVSQVVNLSKFGISNQDDVTVNKPDLFFVCIKEVTPDKDPRYEREYWVADQCAKNLNACKCRYLAYGAYKNGLPFGGFPAIQRYDF